MQLMVGATSCRKYYLFEPLFQTWLNSLLV